MRGSDTSSGRTEPTAPREPNERWHLLIVGRPRLVGFGHELELGRKDAGWLGCVGLRGTVSSVQVATLLWPQGGERGALNNLRQRLFRLRKATGARLVEMSDGLVLAGDLALGKTADREALAADPHAWDGELLGPFEYDDLPDFAAWLAGERQAWRDERRDALAAIASQAETEGRIARALVYAGRLVSDDPLSEHAHRRLMRLHDLRGDRAAAIAAFERCERALRDELGLQPDAETRALLATIERGAPGGPRSPRRPRATPPALHRPPVMVGREGELQQLAEIAEAGGVAVIVGEAGVGKSRLLQEWVAAAPPGSIICVQARPGDSGVPFATLRRLRTALAGGEPDADRADAVTGAGEAQAGDLEALVRARRASGVAAVAIDDLHFADRASVEMLRELIDRESLDGLGWALAHRPLNLAGDDDALLRSLADALRAQWIRLAPLGGRELEVLLRSLGMADDASRALAAQLASHTGGNPLYVLETLRAAQAAPGQPLPRPASIAHLIDRRLQRLSERALALARVAAVAGSDFTPALAEHALATPAVVLASAWAELEAADVLRGTGFAHDLVRDGVLRSTPEPIAVHLHRLVAEHLESARGEPGRIAAHWRDAGESGRAGRAFEAAAERARRAGRPREEAALRQEAGEAYSAAGLADRSVAARALAIAPLLRSAGPAAALAASSELIAAQPAGRVAGLVLAMHALALVWAGQAAEAERVGREALVRIEPHNQHLRLEALRTVAMACGLRGDPGEGIALLGPWLDRIDTLADLAQRVELCGAYTHLLLQNHQFGEAMQVAARHQAFARQTGDRLEELTANINLCAAAVRRGDLDEAIAAAEGAAALDPEDDQARMLVGFNEAVRGFCLCGAGRFREGLERMDGARTRAMAQAPGSAFEISATGYLATVMLQLGQHARARKLLSDDARPSAPHLRALRLVLRALCTSERTAAVALVNEAESFAGAGQGLVVALTARLERARRSAPADAVVLCADTSTQCWARELNPLGTLADALRIDAQRQLDASALDVDDVHALERHARRFRAPYPYFPELLLSAARAYDACGRGDDARRCVEDALDWVLGRVLPDLPPEFRDSFLERNPTNRSLRLHMARLQSAGP